MNGAHPSAKPRIEEDRWLRSAEAAEYLGIEPSTLAKWRYKGEGPRYSCALGRDPRYQLSELAAFMLRAVASSTVEARFKRKEARSFATLE
jgi:predicted site-specific integrase-resolvase